jgi:hypothetical protein
MSYRTYGYFNLIGCALVSAGFLAAWVQGGFAAYAVMFAVYAVIAIAWFERVIT